MLGEYIRHNKKNIILSFVLTFFCYAYLASNNNIRIDSEVMMNGEDICATWLTIGRYGLVLLKKMLGLQQYNSAVSGMLFLIFFALNSNMVTYGLYYLSGKKEYSYGIFLLLVSTSNIWCYQVYFTLQEAEIALAMLLTSFSAFCLHRVVFGQKKKLNFVVILLSTGALVLTFGAYQALVVYYIAINVIFFCSRILNGNCTKNEIIGLGKIIAHFLICYVAYIWVAKMWFMQEPSYLGSQSGWQSVSVVVCVKSIAKEILRTIFMKGPRYFSAFTIGLVLFFIGIIGNVKKNNWDKMQIAICGICFLGLSITPFLMVLYTGREPVTRSQFALPIVSAYMFMVGWQMIFDKVRKCWKCVATGVIITIQIAFCVMLSYSDYIRYKEDVNRTEILLDLLEDDKLSLEKEMPIVFVGANEFETPYSVMRSEMFGKSFYEWDCTKTNPTGASSRIAGFVEAYSGVKLETEITEEQKQRALDKIKSMQTYPDEKSVLIMEDMIVVKLSDIEDIVYQ